MRQRQRKLLGTVILLVFLAVYSAVAALAGAGLLPDSSKLLQLVFYVVAGLAWTLPAGILIKWMQRPDVETPDRKAVRAA